MATSDTEICNQALSHLGSGIEIQDLVTDKSAEAQACRRFYTQTLDEMISDWRWPWATKYVALGLVEENPTTEWRFSYRYPSDCLLLRRIVSGTRNETQQSKIPLRVSQDDDGGLIYTDAQDAVAEYTARVTNVSVYPSDFVSAFALKLAGYIAPRVTAGDPFKLGLRAMQMYIVAFSNAKANAATEEMAEEDPESEFQRARR